MGKCVAFLLFFLFVSTLCAPPSVSKRYRSDYQYNERTDAFYKLHIESRREWNVKSACEEEGASLMAVATHEDIVQVHGMFKQYPDLGKYLWVASDGRAHESAEEKAIINLPDSDEIKSIDDLYNFNDNYEEIHNYAMRAVQKCNVITRSGEIEEFSCNRKLPFVCKVDAKDAPYDRHCDVSANGYHYDATVGSCYGIRRWVATWNKAYAECRDEGAHLVVLNSEAEMVVVRTLLQATPLVHGARNPWYYFAGFRANEPVGNEAVVYRTIFNETLSEAGYAGWSPGEPNNLKGEYCGTLLSSDGMLNDANCHHLYAFICEKEIQPQA